MLHAFSTMPPLGKSRTVPIRRRKSVAAPGSDRFHRLFCATWPITTVPGWLVCPSRSRGPSKTSWTTSRVRPPAVLPIFYLLPERATADVLTQNVPGWEASFARAMFPLIRRGMAKAMNISPGRAQRSLGQLRELMERYGARLADGRRHLCGDTLTADLTFAALASPVIFRRSTPRSRCPDITADADATAGRSPSATAVPCWSALRLCTPRSAPNDPLSVRPVWVLVRPS